MENRRKLAYHHVIFGPMFSGKTREMQKIYSREKSRKRKIQVFKKYIDKRFKGIRSHDGVKFDDKDVFIAKDADDIERQLHDDTEIIMIDEAQFYSKKLVEKIREWVEERGITVITTVLPTDYRGETFGIAGDLLAQADKHTPLTAICEYGDGKCNNPATRSFRKARSKKRILIGGHEAYVPMCRQHFAESMRLRGKNRGTA